MSAPALLPQFHRLFELQHQLLATTPAADAAMQPAPDLPSLVWLVGRSVYRELYWLRERLAGDSSLTTRITGLFDPATAPLAERCARMPPPDHLLNWALEIRDDHLSRLANPGQLPSSPLLAGERLQWYLLQMLALDYETMLQVLQQTRLNRPLDYRVERPLAPRLPATATVAVTQGHYRIGPRALPTALDCELPAQAVELSSFRIALNPVTNAEYLAFLVDGGYPHDPFWSDAGRAWRDAGAITAPQAWRRDRDGRWYQIGIGGPTDLQADDPVTGISHHEALAYARWVDARGGALAGAIVQHEYQWEIAARAGELRGTGRALEWCANPFHPYPEFVPFPDTTSSAVDFDGAHPSLRGASIHSQPPVRRASFRRRARPGDRHLPSGLRLVFPPE